MPLIGQISKADVAGQLPADNVAGFARSCIIVSGGSAFGLYVKNIPLRGAGDAAASGGEGIDPFEAR